jgi:hypothetical protein
MDGGKRGGMQLEGPKRLILMKISKKLKNVVTCIFSDGNAKPNFVNERHSETRIFKS